MIYKDFQGTEAVGLGMGCMRLPRNSASDADVNEAETAGWWPAPWSAG